MDERYLDELFGHNRGYVAVASKAGEGKGDWTEQSFLWPNDRQELVSWVNERTNTDLFICPALRKEQGRRKGDGAHLQWLWADVDWQDIPQAHHDRVRSRIARMAQWVVQSGSGDNCHVYIKLTKPVEINVWRRLNAGLRAYLDADAKHTDNALLRIPGTRNYKPGGKRVVMQPGRGVIRRPEKLLTHAAWRNVVVTEDSVSDGTWERVDVTVTGGVKAMVTMDVDEAIGRYGSRHGAVYRVTAWLSKRGYTSDQIHTLMSSFKAGLSKQDDERGYDLHQDVARCLAQHPTREAIDDEGAIAVIEETGVEEAEDEDPEEALRDRILKRVQGLDVERLARQFLAQRDFLPPPDSASVSMDEALAADRPPTVYAVEGLAAAGQNITITGQYKSGKSMLAINLVRSLCDHTSFLDDRKVRQLRDDETVGLWSLEMSERDLVDHYVMPQQVEHPERMKVFNGRGYGVNILTDVGRAWAVNWLKDRGCGIWVIDSFARVCRMAGVDENENSGVLELLHRLDEIKLEAGVDELFLLAHTGRAAQEEGRERARGATVLDDWADARWVFTRDGATRFLAVEGRSVAAMEATSLSFDDDTHRLTMSGHDRVASRVADLCALAIQLVTEMPPRHYSKNALVKVMGEKTGRSKDYLRAAVDEAEETGFLRSVPGPNRSKLYELTPTKSDAGGASVRVLDMHKVKDRGDGRRRPGTR